LTFSENHAMYIGQHRSLEQQEKAGLFYRYSSFLPSPQPNTDWIPLGSESPLTDCT